MAASMAVAAILVAFGLSGSFMGSAKRVVYNGLAASGTSSESHGISPIYARTLKMFQKLTMGNTHYFDPVTKMTVKVERAGHPAKVSATPAQAGSFSVTTPAPVTSLLDTALWCEVRGDGLSIGTLSGLTLIDTDILSRDLSVDPSNAVDFIKQFARFSKISTRMRQLFLNYEAYLRAIHSDQSAFVQDELMHVSELQKTLTDTKSELPEFLCNNKPIWGRTGSDEVVVEGCSLSIECQEDGGWFAVPPRPNKPPSVQYKYLSYIRPSRYWRSVVALGLREKDSKVVPLMDIKGSGYGPYVFDHDDGLIKPFNMKKLRGVGHASGLADVADCRWEFVVQKWTAKTLASPLFQPLLQAWGAAWDRWLAIKKKPVSESVLSEAAAELSHLTKKWNEYGVTLGSGGLPTDVGTVEAYGVLEFTGLEAARHNGYQETLGLLLRQVSQRTEDHGEWAENIQIPMNKYGALLQMLCYAIGGIQSLSGMRQNVLYYNIQTDFLGTRIFDFGHYKVYAFNKDGEGGAPMQGPQSTSHSHPENVANALKGLTSYYNPSIASDVDTVYERLSVFAQLLVNMYGDGEAKTTEEAAATSNDLHYRGGRRASKMWWPGSLDLMIDFARFLLKEKGFAWYVDVNHIPLHREKGV